MLHHGAVSRGEKRGGRAGGLVGREGGGVHSLYSFLFPAVASCLALNPSPPVQGNALWEYDGWGPDWNGGIYHEGGHDTTWGRAFGFWKREVRGGGGKCGQGGGACGPRAMAGTQ